MKILVVGNGGREHALVWKLARSPLVTDVFCAPGNAGTALDGQNLDINANDVARLIKFSKTEKIDLTVIGPEAPLAAGMVDAFEDAHLLVFGPTREAAELEGSKAFAKDLMRLANVPTADYAVFDDATAAAAHVEERSERPLVIKADGLAAGKGVIVCPTRQEAVAAIRHIMVDQPFGQAGKRIVVEECLVGQEASILAIVDGSTIVPLEPAQDHKAAYDDDKGPNTGGMGAYSPTPLITPELLDEIIEKVLVPTVHTMKREGRPFRGILYAGVMITSQGPKVLEFNVRFGDPEAQPVLMRLKTDLAEILLAAAEGKLKKLAPLEWDPRPSVCVVMAAEGYPGPYQKGHPIRGLEEAAKISDVKVFHAGTAQMGDQVVTDGGRVLGVTALGNTIADAKLRAYQAVKCIRWEGAWCRKDISDKARRS
ncbi:MAG TPA: phosphoribosylamine--glycine ligase [Planctomycetaceae bacterium]|jgi:phosphoribosylamine--glycine ligase|nr:phosphoribosylamine--glycine ligase [Planctomycetaceae bacterium]